MLKPNWLIAIIAAFLSGNALAGDPSVAFDVGVESFTLHDAGRNKDLPVAVLFPKGEHVKAAEKFSLIIFSHGAAGSRDGYRDLTAFWTAHGYIVVCPTHEDSLALPDAGQAGGTFLQKMSKTLARVRTDSDLWTSRARDVTFLLDSPDAMAEKVPAIKGRIDTARIGVGGHSLGAHTSGLIGGATIKIPGDDLPQSFADPRPLAFLLLSPQGSGQLGLNKHSWDKFTRPMMVMTGSNDRELGGKGPESRCEPFHFAPAGDKYLLFLEGANHFTFAGRIRPAQRDGENTSELFKIIQADSLAFWDAYLRKDEKARDYLQSDAPEKAAGGVLKYSRR